MWLIDVYVLCLHVKKSKKKICRRCLHTWQHFPRSLQLTSTLRRPPSSVDRRDCSCISVYVEIERADRMDGWDWARIVAADKRRSMAAFNLLTATKRNRNTESDRASANREAPLGSGGLRFR